MSKKPPYSALWLVVGGGLCLLVLRLLSTAKGNWHPLLRPVAAAAFAPLVIVMLKGGLLAKDACRSAAVHLVFRFGGVNDGLSQERDKELANAFDDFRRSTAVMQLGIMRKMNLLADEDLSLFSEQTRTRVEGIATL